MGLILGLFFFSCGGLVFSVNAEEKVEKALVSSEKIVKQESHRKKKIQICAECGRPESKCDCGHSDNASDVKDEQPKHGPADGHGH